MTTTKKLSSIFLLFVITSACSLRGTEGGNPQNGAASENPGLSLFSQELPNKMCEARRKCVNDIQDLCGQNLLVNSEITFELGINSNFRDLNELIDAEEANFVLINQAAFNECTTEIMNLACNSGLATEAFVLGDYSRMQVLLRSSNRCREIFSLK